MTNSKYKKGDILKGAKCKWEEAFHYIVYYSGNAGEVDFIGSFISTKAVNENIPMLPTHYKKGFKVGYKNSHLAKGKYFKLKDWAPYKKVGQLTELGVKFLEENIGHLKPVLYKSYTANLR